MKVSPSAVNTDEPPSAEAIFNDLLVEYSNTCVKWPYSNRPNIGFQELLMQVKKLQHAAFHQGLTLFVKVKDIQTNNAIFLFKITT